MTGSDNDRGLGESPFRIAVGNREYVFAFHEVVIAFTFLLRLLMAWIFLYAGFEKAFEGFTAEGFLVHATSGPLKGWLVSMGNDPTALAVVNPLVMVGQILIGFGLLLGVATRLALFFAGIMMFLFYLAQFPPEYDLFADYFLVYIVVFLMLGALGAGRIGGLDRYVERWPVVRAQPWLKYLLG